MAEIPSALPTAAAQAALRARELADGAQGLRAEEEGIASRNVKSADQAGAIVDTEDADSRVFTDAEGQGSQGRASSEEETEPETIPQTSPTDSGITRSADGYWHVDLEA